MKRDLAALEGRSFDLLVVGGGIFGACAACDAAQRGLSVALIERADFGGASSANSYKLLHGGIRYLQHADIQRIRESSIARRAFLRIAPHLTQPLPFVVPTYGHGMKSKWAMGAGMAIYDALTFDRNRGIRDPHRRIPGGRLLSREEVLARYPGLAEAGLTGAAVFSDGHIYNPPRLVLDFVKTAAAAGAVVANYLEATRFLLRNGSVEGIEAFDRMSGSVLQIRARCVLNVAGPCAERLLQTALGISTPPTKWSRDAYFVVPRRLVEGNAALALPARTKDPEALLSRGRRHLFLVPWRGHTTVGVWHKTYNGDPDCYTVTDEELDQFVTEINEAYPALALGVDDISMWNAGLIPFGENDPDAQDLKFGHRSRLIDHGATHRINGLITLIGVRFTTAPCEVVKAVDLALHKTGGRRAPSRLADTPVDGGDISDFGQTVLEIQSDSSLGLPPNQAEALAHNHGSRWRRVLDVARGVPGAASPIGASTVLRAEIVHAAREEMALTLADAVLRRTDLGSADYPGDESLAECAQLMGRELCWSDETMRIEVEKTRLFYPARFREEPCSAIPDAVMPSAAPDEIEKHGVLAS